MFDFKRALQNMIMLLCLPYIVLVTHSHSLSQNMEIL